MQAMTIDPYASVLRCNFRASFRLIDKTAAADVSVSGTNYNAEISQLQQTADGAERMTAKYATFETYGWPLDGSCDILPDDVSGIQTGLWSEPSGADKTFSTEPTLIYPFTANHSSYGFTVLFDDKSDWYPASMTVAAYNAAGALLDSKTLDITSARQVVDMPVNDYRTVVLTFHATREPYQCVRCCKTLFGVVEYFDKSNLARVEVLYELSLRGDAFPAGKLLLTFDNSDAKYNMRAPDSKYAYLQAGQPIDDVEIGLGEIGGTGLEYVSMGDQFYYNSADAKDSSETAQITAYDIVPQLDKKKYRKGVLGTDTVENLIGSVNSDSGYNLTVVIPDSVAARVVGSSIPIVTHRKAYRLIAEAAGCSLFIDRTGALRLIEIAAGTPADTLDSDNMVSYPDIGVEDAVNTVNVKIYSAYQQSESAETIYEGVISVSGTQSVWVKYSDPAESPSASVSGGTLVSAEYYLYAAKLTITASGDVTVTVSGIKMALASSEYTADNIENDELAQAYEVDNELIVTTAMAAAVAEYQLGISRINYPVTEMGNPARELGDTVTIYDAYGGSGAAVVTKERYVFDGGLSCEVEAVG